MREWLTVSPSRKAVVLAVGQGIILYILHQLCIHSQNSDGILFIVPAYAVTFFGVLFMQLQPQAADSMRAVKAIALVITFLLATGCWAGWLQTRDGVARVVNENWLTSGDSWREYANISYGFAISVAMLLLVPFLQSWMLGVSMRQLPYQSYFQRLLANFATALQAGSILVAFWLILMLGAGLFSLINIRVFERIIEKAWFVYPVSSLVFGLAMHYMYHKREESELLPFRRVMTACKYLLPMASVIALSFLLVLPAHGLDLLWKTRMATSLLLLMQLVVILLVNSVYSDGKQGTPYGNSLQKLVLCCLIALPCYALICMYGLWLRVAQYGWTADRVWAALFVALAAVVTFAYAYSAVISLRGKQWLPGLGRINMLLAVGIIGVIGLIYSPVLSPERIGASSQMARLFSGKTDIEKFDFIALRFDHGRPGIEAARTLSALQNHPQSEKIRALAEETLKRKYRYQDLTNKRMSLKDDSEIAQKLHFLPEDTVVDAEFIVFLKKQDSYDIACLDYEQGCRVFVADLNGDGVMEYILFAYQPSVYQRTQDGWKFVGRMQSANMGRVTNFYEEKNISVEKPAWDHLLIGDTRFTLIPTQNNKK